MPNLQVLWYLLYLAIGCFEWFLALRRTLALVRNQRMLATSIVFIENLVGLLVLSRFVKNDDWVIAVVYAIGSSLGTLLSFKFTKNPVDNP
jgi:uncharacterized protein YebE (UPF0316 family)